MERKRENEREEREEEEEGGRKGGAERWQRDVGREEWRGERTELLHVVEAINDGKVCK